MWSANEYTYHLLIFSVFVRNYVIIALRSQIQINDTPDKHEFSIVVSARTGGFIRVILGFVQDI
jgi:hypothetical protein